MTLNKDMSWAEVIQAIWPDTGKKFSEPRVIGNAFDAETGNQIRVAFTLPRAGVMNKNCDVMTEEALAKAVEQFNLWRPSKAIEESTTVNDAKLVSEVGLAKAQEAAVIIKRYSTGFTTVWGELDSTEVEQLAEAKEQVIDWALCELARLAQNKMTKDNKVSNPTVELLNRILKYDAGATTCLLTQTYVPCNVLIVEDEHVIAHPIPCETQPEQFMLGALGLINGILAANGLPKVASKWSNDCPPRLLGFQEYVQTTPEPRI
jgi:hypothetical protein